MDVIKDYKFIAIVQLVGLESNFSYSVEIDPTRIDKQIMDNLLFGFHQGIDDNHNTENPSFIMSKGFVRLYLNGFKEDVRMDYFAVPNGAVKDFMIASQRFSDEKTKESFYYWYYLTIQIPPKPHDNTSELLADEFYNQLMRKGGL